MAEHVRILVHLPVRGWARGSEQVVELTPDIALLAERGTITIAAIQGIATPEPPDPEPVADLDPDPD